MTTTIDRKALSAAIALIKPSISIAQKALSYTDAQLPFVTLRLGSGELAIMVPTSKPTKPSDPVPVGAVSVPAETTGSDTSILVNGKFLSSIKSLLDKSKRATKVSISVKEGERPTVEYNVGLLKSTKGGGSAYGYGSQVHEEIEWVQALPREKGLPYQYSHIGKALPFSKKDAKLFKKYAESIGRTFRSQPDLDDPPPPIPATVIVKVNGTQLEDFAQVPEIDLGPVRTTGGFKVPTSDAKAMMEPITSNMSKDTTRSHLNAALFSVGKHGLRMVSTDGHRLMVATLPTETKGETEIVVPAPLVEFLTKAVSKSKSKTVGFSAKKDVITASVDLAGTTAAIRVPNLDLTFPAYNQVVPRKQDAYVTMTLDVKATVPIVKLFANLRLILSERVQGILIGVTPEDSPAISMDAGDLPEYNPSVLLPGTAKIHAGQDPVIVGVNAPYLVDALLGFEDKVKLNLRDELDPILLYGKVGNIDFEAVVMPMRISAGKENRSIIVKPVPRDGTDPMPVADLLAMAKYADYFASPSGSTLSVLETILVKSQMGRLSMTANDLYSTASTSLPCSGPQFELAVKSKDLTKAIAAFPKDAKLSLAWNNEHIQSPGLLIRDIEGGIQFGITGLRADSFPPVPTRDGKPAGIVSSEALIPLIRGVEATASRDDTRAHLHGVAWRINKDSWEAITTDGHRATWGRISLPAGTGPTLKGDRHIMELKAALGVPKMIDSLTGPARNIELKVGEKNSSLSIHDTVSGLERHMTYKMVDGKSPDFEAVYSMAAGFVTAVSANTKQLQEGATLINAAEKTTNQPESVAVESSSGKLVLRSVNAKAKTTMPLVFEGQPPSFAMNPEYIVQLCKASSDEQVTLYDSGVSRFGTDKASPGPIRCWFTNSPYVHLDWLCMPMRAKDATRQGEIGVDAKLASISPPTVSDPPAAPLVVAGARRAPKAKPARKQPPKVRPTAATRLNILDAGAFEKLTELEGNAWAKWQRANASEPSTFIDSLEAYKIMSDMLASGELEPTVRDETTGKMRPVMIHDVTGSAGFSGADDEVYVVATDGEILVFGDTLSKAKLAKARKVLRVVGDTTSRTSARQSVERTSAKRSRKKASAKRSRKKASAKRSRKKASAKRSSRATVLNLESYLSTLTPMQAGKARKALERTWTLGSVGKPGDLGYGALHQHVELALENGWEVKLLDSGTAILGEGFAYDKLPKVAADYAEHIRPSYERMRAAIESQEDPRFESYIALVSDDINRVRGGDVYPILAFAQDRQELDRLAQYISWRNPGLHVDIREAEESIIEERGWDKASKRRSGGVHTVVISPPPRQVAEHRNPEDYPPVDAGYPWEVGMRPFLDTHSLEDWRPGQPDIVIRRVRIDEVGEYDGRTRVSATILEGPESGRKITGLSPSNLRSFRSAVPSQTRSDEPPMDVARQELFRSKSVTDLFDRLRKYLGRTPTCTEVRTWTNTVLGPWDIPANVLAMCASEREGVTRKGQEMITVLDAAVEGRPGLSWKPSDDGNKVYVLLDGTLVAQITFEGTRWMIRYKSASGATMGLPVAKADEVRTWVEDQYTHRMERRKATTFKKAKTRILDELETRGWDVARNLKKPHATSPDGKLRLIFTPQSVHYVKSIQGRFGRDGHSLWIDIRDVDGPQFAGMVVKKFNIQE